MSPVGLWCGGRGLTHTDPQTGQALVPATLLWLRVYRQSQPDLFRMSLA
ncbi:hypothetical protein [Hydrogenophaga taeniospiralis]|nr:hypothetical protein [Hydrogenophaga taeniospiralis]